MAEPGRTVSPGGPRSLVVDARGLNQSGIGRYVREVLARVLADPRFGPVTLAGRPDEVAPFLASHDPRGVARTLAFPYAYYDPRVHPHWAALAVAGRVRADVTFFPHYDAPLTHRGPRTVLMVHDLLHYRVPELFPAWKRRLGQVLLRRAVAGASRILVHSHATRRDLEAWFPRTARRIQVIPLGVSPEFGARPLRPEAHAKAAALGPYLLCVGNRKPHKNLVAAVEALARLVPDRPALRLVLVGRHFAENDGVARRAAALGVADAVVDIGGVSEEELRALYAGAECLLFPSLYEGFGLPVLEAMSLGTPVVASDRASIPEAAGDAGLLVDPEDPAAMAAAVARVLGEPELRERMVRAGREQAARLTWAQTTARTADALAQAAGPPSAAGDAGRRTSGAPADAEAGRRG